MANKTYWKTKSGQLIDIDEMSIDHLRNTLKMIVNNHARRIQQEQEQKLELRTRLKGDMAQMFNDDMQSNADCDATEIDIW